MATGPSPLPPTFILNSKPISQSAAHDFLSAYIDLSGTDPAYQPSAGISEHGPVSRTTAAAPNLTIHNLKRVKAGLAGEVLGRDLALAKIEEGDAQQQQQQQAGGSGDWQDPQQFEERVDEDPAQEGDDDAQGQMDVDETGENAGAVDKEERKRKKKERRLAEKRAKAQGDAE
ncbi:hypothetical protein BDV25DRAFT_91726 [Aspergillus avenaceus]|uniref:Uncharacterized protein n=1 Tax=Aspergillus avenaceus TaxID=36643 RepID=A0A5N6TEI9_ASPAV|nr:hypothetical protein BDV25DRAFT_91726 [Aspergillus avenaceus]